MNNTDTKKDDFEKQVKYLMSKGYSKSDARGEVWKTKVKLALIKRRGKKD
jgi:hypothetical protein